MPFRSIGCGAQVRSHRYIRGNEATRTASIRGPDTDRPHLCANVGSIQSAAHEIVAMCPP
jgi:hypothetical protein